MRRLLLLLLGMDAFRDRPMGTSADSLETLVEGEERRLRHPRTCTLKAKPRSQFNTIMDLDVSISPLVTREFTDVVLTGFGAEYVQHSDSIFLILNLSQADTFDERLRR